MSTPERRSRGRARSPAADRAILDAALVLLSEVGYERLTMEGVAARAGVGKATLYRRYASKRELVLDAVEHVARLVAGGVASERRADGLERIARATAAFYAGPRGRALLGVVVEMWRSPEVAEAVHERFLEPRREALRAAVRAAVRRGALRGGEDLELALDMIVGAVLYRSLVAGAPLDAAGADRLAAVLRGGLGRARGRR
jgi:AcrR family transcriptional regulator